MKTQIKTKDLKPWHLPRPEAEELEFIRFAQMLNGYQEVGGDAGNLGRYIKSFDSGEGAYLRSIDPEMAIPLSVNDIRILLFARQRAHYHQGGGWGDHDPLMDEMRMLVDLLRDRLESRGPDVVVWQGDITQLPVDAIVNATNESLVGGGGVDKAIHKAAGPQLQEACLKFPQRRIGVRCEVGNAQLTPGFDLPARNVIHTVGPKWEDGEQNERDLLATAYISALEIAVEHGFQSVAFPAISTGAYGFPAADAAPIATATVCSFLQAYSKPLRVLLVAFNSEAREILQQALNGELN